MVNLRVKWWQLSADEVFVLISTVLLLPYYCWLVKRRGLPELLNGADLTKSSDRPTPSIEAAKRLGVVINKVTTIFIGQGSCLLRSVILHKLLLRRGFRSVVCLGALPEQKNFAAHAWVEVDGVPVNDSRSVTQKYRTFETENSSDVLAKL